MNVAIKRVLSPLKPYLRWAILGGTLFFLAKALKDNWQEVLAIRISTSGWTCLAIAVGVTLLAHTWTGWVWHWMLREFDQQPGVGWCIRIYLKVNIAKYLPGNVWHFYGRIWAAKTAGVPLGVATLSVLMEPPMMAVGALLLALISSPVPSQMIQLPILFAVLILIHPWCLNPCLQYLAKLTGKKKSIESGVDQIIRVKRYPILPLLGELGFLGLRGSGFLLTLLALSPISPSQIPLLLSGFSVAWLLGLIVPGAPGGVGVFEATAVGLLEHDFAPAVVLSSVALYRLISILSEVGGAALAWLNEPPSDRSSNQDEE
ncbi:lysylphosphatidylglycerol synthase transmembrane domain-containing protein [Moorena producens]|uniref:lysylphosphatidylglycerol synthase transmembrane domain-containing protein n=1 Tax=Moorena producens TaxID=1155739 RepID=UPI003C71E770